MPDDLIYHFRFLVPEEFHAACLEYIDDVHPRPHDNLSVYTDIFPSKLFGEQLRHGRFAASSHPDEYDVHTCSIPMPIDCSLSQKPGNVLLTTSGSLICMPASRVPATANAIAMR